MSGAADKNAPTVYDDLSVDVGWTDEQQRMAMAWFDKNFETRIANAEIILLGPTRHHEDDL